MIVIVERGEGLKEELRIEGHQFVESQRGKNKKRLVNRTLIEVGDDVRVRIEGVGTGRSAEMVTRSAHIRKFLLDADEAARVAADPPIVPYTKAHQVGSKKAKRTAPNEMVECPNCQGEGWLDCFFCNGGSRVTAVQARAFKSAHE